MSLEFNINDKDYNTLSEINDNLRYKKFNSSNLDKLKLIIQNSKKKEKSSIFEYLLYTEIKNYHIDSLIEVSNYLPKSYFCHEKMDAILFYTDKDYHVPLLVHLYTKLDKINQEWIEEKLNYLVLSKVFSSSHLHFHELKNSLNFIKKENIQLNEKLLEKFIQYQDTRNGLYVETFIDYHHELYKVLSHFSNQGFTIYAKNYAAQTYNQFNYVHTTDKEYFKEIGKGYIFNSDAELVLAILERKNLEAEKLLLENQITSNKNSIKKLKL